MPAGLRRASALVAIVALAVGGAKVIDGHTVAGSGFSAVATVAADPTGGPTGGPGSGPGGMNGSQFQPPSAPQQMPDYQGGNNLPPLDQNGGISIYNSGVQGAPQQAPGEQSAQQPQQGWDQPAHGNQIPDYQTNPGFTQGPGKPNPDAQAPQQGNQPQQGQQQPSQAPTQQQQPGQERDSDRIRDFSERCSLASDVLQSGSVPVSLIGAAGGALVNARLEPGRDPSIPICPDCNPPVLKQFTDGDNPLDQLWRDVLKKYVDEKMDEAKEEAIDSALEPLKKWLSENSTADCGITSCSVYFHKNVTKWLKDNAALTALAPAVSGYILCTVVGAKTNAYVGGACGLANTASWAFLINAINRAGDGTGCLRVRAGIRLFMIEGVERSAAVGL
ncbi:Uncharacterised protein [Mycobacteroides abscessus subsp. abscessus]|nr:Uncharacterised protein [Mycobacteroides abscessus subsp. abscessus]